MPIVQLGRGEAVETAGTALIVKAKALATVARAASFTVTVKLAVPVTVGIPEMTPVAATNDSPVGSDPVVTVHVYAGVPPLAKSVVE